jgi:hypothetical protein
MPETPFSLTANDVTVDESGRVIIHNPEMRQSTAIRER